jgi:Ca2+-binding EF-hand superfamily protein
MAPPEGVQLKIFDVDGDGKLTRDEVTRGLQIAFAQSDSDKDGSLNKVETRALNDQRRQQASTSSPVFDWNADGKVDFKEFANQQLALFDRLDADGDGMLTEQEMTRPQMGPGGPRGGPPGGGPSGGGGRGPRGGGGGR